MRIGSVKHFRHDIALQPAEHRRAHSPLVRRLLRAANDPAKQRIRRWLSDIDDERLLAFGLSREDIVLLRGTADEPHVQAAQTLWRFAPHAEAPYE
jgi:hypothetical protein